MTARESIAGLIAEIGTAVGLCLAILTSAFVLRALIQLVDVALDVESNSRRAADAAEKA